MTCLRATVVGCVTVVGIGIGLARMAWSAYVAFAEADLAAFEDAVLDEWESWSVVLAPVGAMTSPP